MCIALLGACASVKMQKAPLVSAPQANTALVTFVRPFIFLQDGTSIDIWDGERFIGALEAGTLVQYEVEPGQHLFLTKLGAGSWSYTTANLLPGKRYFIKANIYMGFRSAGVVLGIVSKTDPRIEEWQSKLNPMDALPADKQAVESRKQNEIRAAVMEFKAGKVTFTELRPEDGL
jgi:hypothetical protein